MLTAILAPARLLDSSKLEHGAVISNHASLADMGDITPSILNQTDVTSHTITVIILFYNATGALRTLHSIQTANKMHSTLEIDTVYKVWAPQPDCKLMRSAIISIWRNGSEISTFICW